MMLTREREEEILCQYKPYLSRFVRTFESKCKKEENPSLDHDDLFQIASMWFLNTLRKEGLRAALGKRISLHHELYDAVRKSYPLSLPYGQFGKRDREVTFIAFDTEAGEEILRTVGSCCDMEDSVAFTHDFNGVYQQMSERERTVVNMRMDGVRIADIAKHLNVTSRTVNNIISSMRDKYREYFNNDAA